MLSRRTILTGAVAAAAAGALGAPALASPVPGAGWAEDIAILRRAYGALHPGLYRYQTPEETSRRFARLERDFARAASLEEAYLALSRMLATIRCGHSYANFFNQSDAVAAALFNRRTRLPFFFRWIDGRMVVTEPHREAPLLARGAIVEAIDGRDARAMLKTLLAYARADGGNDAKRRALLEPEAGQSLDFFDIFHGLLFPPRRAGFFTLRVRGERGVATIDVPALGPEARLGGDAASADADAPQWTFSLGDDGVGLLRMPGWALYDSRWNWTGFLDEMFATLASERARGLIVDIRGNEGGLDCGHEIISRLIDKDLTLEGYERRVRYRKTPDDLNPYLDTWDNSFRDWGDAATPIDGGMFRLTRWTDPQRGEVIAAAKPRFSGKVAVLIDSNNSSATFQFANIVQSNGLATLVGAPTGGNRRGINGGAFFFLRLPNSGLEVDVPLIGSFPRTPQPDAGILPDIAAAPTIADIRAGRDRALETARVIVTV